MPIDPQAAKAAAHRLVTQFIFHAVKSGATEAKIVYDGQQIHTAYLLNDEWRRQEDMPLPIWPQILRRIRNMAFLTLGPQPPRQEGISKLCLVNRPPDGDGDEREYELQLVINHDECGDATRITIPQPVRRTCKRSEGFVIEQWEKL